MFYCITFSFAVIGAHFVYIKVYAHMSVAVIALNIIVDLVCCADNARDLGKKEAAIQCGYLAYVSVNNNNNKENWYILISPNIQMPTGLLSFIQY